MIKSMTGYGTARVANESLEVTVDIKSLNSKSLDASIRMPKNFSDKEPEIRAILNQLLERGKVNVSIEVQAVGEVKPKVSVNRPLVKAYYKELFQVSAEIGASQQDIFRIILQMPDVFSYENSSDELSRDWELIKKGVQEAVEACNTFRIQEGAELARSLTLYIEKIRSLLVQVDAHDPERMEKIRSRIATHISEIVADEHFDKNRFEQEMIYYIEKLDISEEKVRLRLHLDYFMEVLQKEEAPGKKLNFISQEIGREINTIGSKANDAIIQRHVIDMKEELEKIKEQSLNIL
jgi:uncharacterized protein (TIGR00255 family)